MLRDHSSMMRAVLDGVPGEAAIARRHALEKVVERVAVALAHRAEQHPPSVAKHSLFGETMRH